MSSSRGRFWRLAAVIAAAVFALDQIAKAVVEANLVPGEKVDVLGPLQLTLAHNSGIAFGLASGGGIFLVGLVLVGLVFIVTIFARDPSRPGAWLALGLLAGGALGNLADRLRAGEVTDYVDVLSWPAFNLADVAIFFGVAILAISYLREASGAQPTTTE